MHNYISYKDLLSRFCVFLSNLNKVQVPNTVREALKHPQWKQAVFDEMNALEKNGTWEITTLPPGKQPIDCKWIFTVKYREDGQIDQFNARLVAKGFT